MALQMPHCTTGFPCPFGQGNPVDARPSPGFSHANKPPITTKRVVCRRMGDAEEGAGGGADSNSLLNEGIPFCLLTAGSLFFFLPPQAIQWMPSLP
jgi:hypothetical protein